MSGTAEPGALVEVYSVGADGVVFFEGETAADAGGSFKFQGSGHFRGAKTVCTGTDGEGNTSEMAGHIVNGGIQCHHSTDLCCGHFTGSRLFSSFWKRSPQGRMPTLTNLSAARGLPCVARQAISLREVLYG